MSRTEDGGNQVEIGFLPRYITLLANLEVGGGMFT